MATSSYSRSLVSAVKRLKLTPTTPATPSTHLQTRPLSRSSRAQQATPRESNTDIDNVRLPKAVQATYLAPLKRAPTHKVKVADLQLRSYSVRNLELFSDFALRAAYFLKLPARGPHPLRRITERWTVPRSNFVHKKSQENFERITLRRWIEVFDGNPETVAVWLAYLRKHQYYGVGMKAEVYEHGGLETGKDLDTEAEKIRTMIGEGETYATVERAPFKKLSSQEKAETTLWTEPFKMSWGAAAASGSAPELARWRPGALQKVKSAKFEQKPVVRAQEMTRDADEPFA